MELMLKFRMKKNNKQNVKDIIFDPFIPITVNFLRQFSINDRLNKTLVSWVSY